MEIQRRTPRSVLLHARVEPELRRQAEAAAAAAGVTLSDIVRAGVREAVRNVLAGLAASPKSDT